MRSAAVLLLLVALPVAAQLAVPPAPTRRVNDYAGALSAAEQARLEQKLIDRERTSTNQIVVAIFRSLRGESLEDYSIRLAQAWRVGQKGLDNGVIFLVFLDDRKMRIEVGYGLEGQLTDATAASIIRDVVAPRFRQNRYAEGIEAG
ncbi:MAG TPA: TPM domain-containing protein, partial [Methylomirabilota bacterium]|nr:TPM domain-containing protein [Methylomirabilota bacterium]